MTFPTYYDRNMVKMTSWETCFEAYKIPKIQVLRPLDPLGASRRPPYLLPQMMLRPL
jgi:hypothetical protein